MKDDPDFTLRFVGIIVANPCIYDHTTYFGLQL